MVAFSGLPPCRLTRAPGRLNFDFVNTEKTEQKKTPVLATAAIVVSKPTYNRIVKLLAPSTDRVVDKYRFLRPSGKWDREDILKMADAITHTEDEFEMGIGRSKYASMGNGQAKKLRTARRLCEDFWNDTDEGQVRRGVWPWARLRDY